MTVLFKNDYFSYCLQECFALECLVFCVDFYNPFVFLPLSHYNPKLWKNEQNKIVMMQN